MNRLKRIQFWGEDENDDRLVLQVLNGTKTATADPVSNYDKSYGDFDDGSYEEGDIVEVYDLKRNLRCKIRICEIYTTRFGSIPEKLWKGEGNISAEEFRKDHMYCWSEYDIDDDFEIVAIHFELVKEMDG